MRTLLKGESLVPAWIRTLDRPAHTPVSLLTILSWLCYSINLVKKKQFYSLDPVTLACVALSIYACNWQNCVVSYRMWLVLLLFFVILGLFAYYDTRKPKNFPPGKFIVIQCKDKLCYLK
jgi:hypothetical protein